MALLTAASAEFQSTRLREARRHPRQAPRGAGEVSIHAPAGGATQFKPTKAIRDAMFQSTRLREARLD